MFTALLYLHMFRFIQCILHTMYIVFLILKLILLFVPFQTFIWYFCLCLDKPKIADTTSTTVNEGDRVILKKEIVSNPLSNVSWYNGSKLLDYQVSVTAATLTIEKATCTDTKNFTLIASNTVEKSVSALVELFVNCKWGFV